MSGIYYDPFRTALELREQLSSSKRKLGFLLGAGTSMAVGIPGIIPLTNMIQENLEEIKKSQYKTIRNSISENATVEDILNRVRLIREFMGENNELEISGVKGFEQAKELDMAICKEIYKLVQLEPPSGIAPYITLTQWLHALYGDREWPVEIFTLNYDLLVETAMEKIGLPYFDGFIGAVEPFFVPESVEADGSKINEFVYPPRSWTRLWKLHGSLGWRLREDLVTGKKRITRVTNLDLDSGEELMIFPSREKYMESRRLPFLTFQDRLRKFLSNGEVFLVILGYSFSDEHINEILFQSLRSNPRLSIAVMCYGDIQPKVIAYGQTHRNLSLYGASEACIGGVVGKWSTPLRQRKQNEVWPFWNEETESFSLGDFNKFSAYLELFIGFRGPLSTPQPDLAEESTSKENAVRREE